MKKSILIVLALVCIVLVGLIVLNSQKGEPDAVDPNVVPDTASGQPTSALSAEEGSLPGGEPSSQPETPSTLVATDLYDGLAPVIFDMHQPMQFYSHFSPKQGEGVTKSDWFYYLWDGMTETEVVDAKVAASPEEAGVPAGESKGLTLDESEVYLLLDIRLKNISARFAKTNEDDLDKTPSVSMYNLTTDELFSAEYFDRGIPLICFSCDYYSEHGPDKHTYFDLYLPVGSEKVFSMGFYIPEDVIKNDTLMLSVYKNKMGIRINDIQGLEELDP